MAGSPDARGAIGGRSGKSARREGKRQRRAGRRMEPSPHPAATPHPQEVHMSTTTAERTTPDFAAIKRRQQSTWESGDYAAIGVTLQIVGETLAEAADVRAGESVLDVAAGNGNASLAAARRRAIVTSTDYVQSLLDRGRARGAARRPRRVRSGAARRAGAARPRPAPLDEPGGPPPARAARAPRRTAAGRGGASPATGGAVAARAAGQVPRKAGVSLMHLG